MAASGTTKRISANNILSSSPTASGALTVTGLVTAGSATITGALGAAGLNVTSATIPANGVYLGSANNLSFSAASTLGMTLNSTGLGVGTASPAFKLDVSGSAGSGIRFTGNSVSTVMGETGGFGLLGTTTNHNLGLYTNGSVKATIDTSGNVGVGVTPEAWTAFNPVLRIKNTSTGGGGALASTGIDNFRMLANTYYDGQYKRIGAGYATVYEQASGQHVWYSNGTAGAGTTFTPTQVMTLDASGNLILQSSATPATLNTNGQLTVNATSNTNLRFSYRGSDGTTRVANITLA
jgi:predicted outer membrane repeat protein